MSTLLDRSSLPVWVFVIIIVVGSLCILITAALLIRCHVMKRKAKRNSSALEQGPMRRMTVKRGRMVPASNYLSLTGSKFGLNQFEDAETVKSGRRSPFEWWTSIKDKRPGDEMSQHTRSGSIGDIFSRREFAQSTNSLASVKEASNAVHEVEPAPDSPTALPSPTSHRTASFSRPFNPRASSSPFMHHARNLSMIQEASPHNSIVSVRSNPRKSGMSINAHDGNLTRYEPRRPSQVSRASSSSIPSSPHTASTPHTMSNPDLLRSPAYQGSRSSLGEIERPQPTLSKRSSMSRHDSVTDVSRHRSSKAPVPAGENTEDYWSSRRDLQPVRSNSKKGKVLRKKSLKRQEVYSMVAS